MTSIVEIYRRWPTHESTGARAMNAIQEIAMAIAVSLFGLAFAAAIVWSVLVEIAEEAEYRRAMEARFEADHETEMAH